MFHHGSSRSRTSGRAFTLVELLVVIGIIAILMGLLVPALAKSRESANTAKCLSNLRNLAIAHASYVTENRGYLIDVGLSHGGSVAHSADKSWVKTLQRYYQTPLAARCPSDTSLYWDTPIPGSDPPLYRVVSYGVNNFLSPSHAPEESARYMKITQVRRTQELVHFIELSEISISSAASDHVHVENWYMSGVPDSPPQLAGGSMDLARHGGHAKGWDGLANYAFLDGHIETRRFRDVYTNPRQNSFDPRLQ